MGVMYDYFAAPSDEAAATTIDQPGGPGTGPRLPMPFKDLVAKYGMESALDFLKPQLLLSDHGFYVESTKGFDPVADLGAIATLLTGHDLDPDYHLIAERDGGERLVLWISDGTREALEHATDDTLAAAAQRWVQNQAQWRTIDPEPVAHLLTQLAELARTAAARSERLYCWVCV